MFAKQMRRRLADEAAEEAAQQWAQVRAIVTRSCDCHVTVMQRRRQLNYSPTVGAGVRRGRALHARYNVYARYVTVT